MSPALLLAFIRESDPGTPITTKREDLLALIKAENPDGRSEAAGPRDRSERESYASASYVPLKTWARERGVSEKTVRRWIKAGALRGVKKLPGRGGYVIPPDAGAPVAEKTEVVATRAAAPTPRSRWPLPEEVEL